MDVARWADKDCHLYLPFAFQQPHLPRAGLALHAENEAVQVAACKELLDRAIGRAVQPHTGEGAEGPVIIQVVTGVPRATEQGF
jgi:hypothetical protein